MEPKTILGLSVNTRTIGLALLSQGQLKDLAIQLRKEPWTPQKKERILASLRPWCSYSIHSIALSMPRESHLTREIKELLDVIRLFFTKEKITLKAYPVKAVYQFCGNARKRTELMAKLVLLHPELIGYYQKETANKNKYYIKLFEAVGVASLHYQQIRTRERKGP